MEKDRTGASKHEYVNQAHIIMSPLYLHLVFCHVRLALLRCHRVILLKLRLGLCAGHLLF